jgi:hypothetical protein
MNHNEYSDYIAEALWDDYLYIDPIVEFGIDSPFGPAMVTGIVRSYKHDAPVAMAISAYDDVLNNGSFFPRYMEYDFDEC